MKLWLKLLGIVALAAGAQFEIGRHVDELDMAQFELRVCYAELTGDSLESEELVAAARGLTARAEARCWQREQQMGRSWPYNDEALLPVKERMRELAASRVPRTQPQM